MQLRFPPPNPTAFSVPQELFEQGLPLSQNSMLIGETAGADGFRKSEAKAKDYHNLWEHLLLHYWPELYDTHQVLGREDFSKLEDEVSYGDANASIRNLFKDLLDEFEGKSTSMEDELSLYNSYVNNPSANASYNMPFIFGYYGEAAAQFYSESKGIPVFPSEQRVSAWESFLRTQEIGERRYNIFLWVWDFLLKVLTKMQHGTLNKAMAQKWMNTAQKKAIEEMADIKDSFEKQRSSEDYGRVHTNQILNQQIDIIRGERSNVQRMSSAKSQDVSAYQQKTAETNTFLRTMIEQLESALRSVLK